MLPVIYLFIGYTNCIRVHEDENEMATTQMTLVTAAINSSDMQTTNTSRTLNTQNSTTIRGHFTTQATIIMRNMTTQ